MKSQNFITNILLTLIAILLLVLVIQGSSKSGYAPSKNPHAGENYESGNFSQDASQNAPHVHGEEQPFNPNEMVFAALRCPNDDTLTLGEPGCSGKGVEDRKKLVEESFAKGQGLSQVFDAIVKKFGEKALTDQAIEIRKSMGK